MKGSCTCLEKPCSSYLASETEKCTNSSGQDSNARLDSRTAESSDDVTVDMGLRALLEGQELYKTVDEWFSVEKTDSTSDISRLFESSTSQIDFCPHCTARISSSTSVAPPEALALYERLMRTDLKGMEGRVRQIRDWFEKWHRHGHSHVQWNEEE